MENRGLNPKGGGDLPFLFLIQADDIYNSCPLFILYFFNLASSVNILIPLRTLSTHPNLILFLPCCLFSVTSVVVFDSPLYLSGLSRSTNSFIHFPSGGTSVSVRFGTVSVSCALAFEDHTVPVTSVSGASYIYFPLYYRTVMNIRMHIKRDHSG